MSANFSIRIEDETKQGLDRLAAATGRSRNYHIDRALAEYVAHTAWQVERTRAALASLEHSEGVAVEDVIADQIAKGHVTHEALERARAERLAESDAAS
jgi:RHH-type transcriptional regulator, rel operon repressor / antitoxin RelB